ncbi:MAG: type II/IV secretion system ATPase subunit [archaeon]|jgi:type IV secretory pathway ATPase VirB11/archaellum biosynthesis ATPase
MDEIGYLILQTEFSKKLSESKSGNIVKKKDKNYFLLNFPELNDKEKNIFLDILKDLKYSKINISKKADVYFFLKNYCLQNYVILRKDQREKISQLIEWETLGDSILEPLINDPDFEEIVINGINKPLMIYHNIFGWLTSNVYFTKEDKIRNLINKIASPLGRQLSFNNPILNATLTNGSRLNATMDPIAFSGINATIRKFKENPLTPIDLVNFGTIDKKEMAFLWLTMQTASSVLICGNTGSGKTTTLNSLFCFLPKEERIVVVEETPEIVLPQEHKVKMNTAQQVDVGLDKLIENTFRMRPDRVIVGEVRSPLEGRAFVNTMLAGQAKGSYATFHAESANEAIERLTSFNIEKSSLSALDLIIVQKRITKINTKNNSRREERKITEICEIIKDENTIKLNKLFENGKIVNESTRVKDKIKQTFSFSEKTYQKFLKDKENVLGKLNKGISFNEFFELVENE